MIALLPPPSDVAAPPAPPRLRRLPSCPPRPPRRWVPWAASALVHTVLFAGLWEVTRPLGDRGSGSSATSDADRPDSVSTATWEPPEDAPRADDEDAPPPQEAEPVFEMATDPVDVARPEEPPLAEAPVPDEVEPTLEDVETPAPSREPDRLPAFGPGHPIPRIARAIPVPARSSPATAAPAVAAASRAPTPPPAPPPSPARGGGGEGLRPPVADPGNRRPAWPADAFARGERGRVQLRLRVTADGQVALVTVAASSGSASLDSAAVAAAYTWRFRPATRDGVAIDAWVLRGVTFQ